MKKILHKEAARGRGDYEWLTTRYSFSFADWYDETKMGFGKLRVLNDDVIAPGKGFGMHGHRDMEIVTLVRKGAVRHEDSMDNIGIVEAGDIQVMSAGTGVLHSEFNNSDTESLELFQLWIEPRTQGSTPTYSQKSFVEGFSKNTFRELVGKDGLSINQDAYISYMSSDEDSVLAYHLHTKTNGVYLFVVEGGATVDGVLLEKRDALGVYDCESVAISVTKNSEILAVEVPFE